MTGKTEAISKFPIEFVAITLLVIVAAITRFYNIGFNSIWLDEAATYMFSQPGFIEIWETTVAGEYNPPLFHWFEHVIISIAGASEISLRFLPAVFGIALVPVTYELGKMVNDKYTGFVAALLVALAPVHIFYSQEARAYTLAVLLTTIALWAHLKLMDLRDANISERRNKIILYGVITAGACALAVWSHFYAFIFVAVIFAHGMWYFRTSFSRDRKMWGFGKEYIIKAILPPILFIWATLPLLIVTVSLYFRHTQSAPTYGMSGIDLITSTLVYIAGYNTFVVVVVLGAALLGIATLFKERQEIAIVLIVISLALLFGGVFLADKIPILPRYNLYLLPLIMVMAAEGILFVKRKFDSKLIPIAILAIILVGCAPPLAEYYQTYTKDDWRGFSTVLQANTLPGDTVVVIPWYITYPLDFYYTNETDGTIEIVANYSHELDSLPAGRKVFIVTPDISAVDPNLTAISWLNKNAINNGIWPNAIMIYTKKQ